MVPIEGIEGDSKNTQSSLVNGMEGTSLGELMLQISLKHQELIHYRQAFAVNCIKQMFLLSLLRKKLKSPLLENQQLMLTKRFQESQSAYERNLDEKRKLIQQSSEQGQWQKLAEQAQQCQTLEQEYAQIKQEHEEQKKKLNEEQKNQKRIKLSSLNQRYLDCKKRNTAIPLMIQQKLLEQQELLNQLPKTTSRYQNEQIESYHYFLERSQGYHMPEGDSKRSIIRFNFFTQWRDNKQSNVVSQIRQKTIKLFLDFVMRGDLDKVELMLQANPKLALVYSDVTDLSGRSFKGITAFQYAFWALDFPMLEILKKTEDFTVEMQRHQIEELELKGTAYGKNFTFEPIIKALEEYFINFKKAGYTFEYNTGNGYTTCVDAKFINPYWRKIGELQRQFPANIVSEHLRGKNLPRTLQTPSGEWFEALSEEAKDVAFIVGTNDGQTVSVSSVGGAAGSVQHGFKSGHYGNGIRFPYDSAAENEIYQCANENDGIVMRQGRKDGFNGFKSGPTGVILPSMSKKYSTFLANLAASRKQHLQALRHSLGLGLSTVQSPHP